MKIRQLLRKIKLEKILKLNQEGSDKIKSVTNEKYDERIMIST